MFLVSTRRGSFFFFFFHLTYFFLSAAPPRRPLLDAARGRDGHTREAARGDAQAGSGAADAAGTARKLRAKMLRVWQIRRRQGRGSPAPS